MMCRIVECLFLFTRTLLTLFTMKYIARWRCRNFALYNIFLYENMLTLFAHCNDFCNYKTLIKKYDLDYIQTLHFIENIDILHPIKAVEACVVTSIASRECVRASNA